jgi:membrane-associated phospholipid phosphatase
MVWPLKLAVHRERPNQGSHHSFPSGDAASAAAAAWPLQRIHPLALPAAATAVCGVAAGRVLTGAHYPSDVLAGAAIGALAGGLAVATLRRARLRLSWRHFAAAAAALAVAGVLAGTLKPRGDLERMASVMIFLGPPAALAVALRVFRVWRRRRRRS